MRLDIFVATPSSWRLVSGLGAKSDLNGAAREHKESLLVGACIYAFCPYRHTINILEVYTHMESHKKAFTRRSGWLWSCSCDLSTSFVA